MMKKLFITMILMVMVTFMASAQYSEYGAAPQSGTVTLTETDSISIFTYDGEVLNTKDVLIQYDVTTSGTSDGHFYAEKSLDGENWFQDDDFEYTGDTTDIVAIGNDALFYRLKLVQNDSITNSVSVDYTVVSKK